MSYSVFSTSVTIAVFGTFRQNLFLMRADALWFQEWVIVTVSTVASQPPLKVGDCFRFWFWNWRKQYESKNISLFFTSTDQSCPEFWDRSKDWLRREEGGFTQCSETAQHQVWSNTLSRVPLEREKEWVHQKTHSPLLAIHHSFVFSKILIPWSLLKSYLKLSDGSSCICFCYCLIWKKNEKDCRVFVYCNHITCRSSSIYNMFCCSVKAPESIWTLLDT